MADLNKGAASASEQPVDHNKYQDINPNRSNDGNSGSPPTEIDPENTPAVEPGKRLEDSKFAPK
ncbi:hypothetical protein SAMN05192566_1585 [Methylophilus rhizosphaerae]|uniref:Uncharacterized protein n=1 Tax=Methylophilus rhizosphaerae TaxID=492660 RepID=A0A1G9CR39_9PROT|nr:hypothetical protein [Methylophilus rhizosphaerae]SDK54122.1 hypothetical protein SAMN05192566_1585 [Methylophilus rhizosphaerae]